MPIELPHCPHDGLIQGAGFMKLSILVSAPIWVEEEGWEKRKGESLSKESIYSPRKRRRKKSYIRENDFPPSHPPFCRPWLEAEKRLFVSLFQPFKSRKERERESIIEGREYKETSFER